MKAWRPVGLFMLLVMIIVYSAARHENTLGSPQEKVLLGWHEDIAPNFEARWIFEEVPTASRWNDPLLPFGPLLPLLGSAPLEGSSLSLKVTDNPPTSTTSDNFTWSMLAPYDRWLEVTLDGEPLSPKEGIILLLTPQHVRYNQTEGNLTIPVDAFGATVVLDLIMSELEEMRESSELANKNPRMFNSSRFEEPILTFSWVLQSNDATLNVTTVHDIERGLLNEYYVTVIDADQNIIDRLIVKRDLSSGSFISGFDAGMHILGLILLAIPVIVRTKTPQTPRKRQRM